MKKFKVIETYFLLEKDTVVIDTGVNESATSDTGKEFRNVLIDGNSVAITYSVPTENLVEIE